MELNKSHILSAVAGVAVGAAIVFSMRACNKSLEPEPEPIVIHDTITVTDTLRIKEHTKPVKQLPPDTFYLYMVEDTLHDTIRVEIPMEQKEYRDTFATDSSRIELGVLFSGYKAKIDSIDLQYRFEVQPRVKVQKKGWSQFVGIGVGAGYGASIIGNQVYAAPQIGVSIVYGFGYHF